MADLTIIVNSCDGFADCWRPFFHLFARYWPGCAHPIVLNTERLGYEHPGLGIRCSRVAAGNPSKLTWSECLMRCLAGIDTPFVLYLQEDFFLEAPVRTDVLDELLGEMRAGRADVIRLMECDGSGPWHPTEHPLLWEVDRYARYRIALQAALWRKTTLLRQLRRHENAWQLEVFGSARARGRREERVFCVNRDRLHGPGREVFPYTPTGVVKGQWERFVPQLFEREGIVVDFSRRGFWDPASPPSAKRPWMARGWDRLRSLV